MREFGFWSRVGGAVALMLIVSSASVDAQITHVDSTFRWSEVPRSGDRLVLKNMNGNIRVRGGDTDRIDVRAIKTWTTGNPTHVQVDVSRVGPNGNTILMCGIWKGEILACEVEGHVINNDGRNDTRMDFEVTVPRGTRVGTATVNGDVYMVGLTGEMNASAVNGDVTVAFARDPNIDLSVTSVNGTFRSDFATSAPIALRRTGTRARLGRGGQTVSLSTVNGELRLVRN